MSSRPTTAETLLSAGEKLTRGIQTYRLTSMKVSAVIFTFLSVGAIVASVFLLINHYTAKPVKVTIKESLGCATTQTTVRTVKPTVILGQSVSTTSTTSPSLPVNVCTNVVSYTIDGILYETSVSGDVAYNPGTEVEAWYNASQPDKPMMKRPSAIVGFVLPSVFLWVQYYINKRNPVL